MGLGPNGTFSFDISTAEAADGSLAEVGVEPHGFVCFVAHTRTRRYTTCADEPGHREISARMNRSASEHLREVAPSVLGIASA